MDALQVLRPQLDITPLQLVGNADRVLGTPHVNSERRALGLSLLDEDAHEGLCGLPWGRLQERPWWGGERESMLLPRI